MRRPGSEALDDAERSDPFAELREPRRALLGQIIEFEVSPDCPDSSAELFNMGGIDQRAF